MTSQRIALGKKGESVARDFLEKAGYKILVNNYRTRCGEIDIIARDRQTLVFVEVKTRRNNMYGTAFEAITYKKQRQISRVAAEYVVQNGVADSPARFDVVSVSFETSTPRIDLVQDAFEFTHG